MVVSRQRPGLRRLPRRPSPTDGMEICPGCTSLPPLKRTPPPLGTDQVPAARCFFGDEKHCSRASSGSGFRTASFLFAHSAVPDGIFIPSVIGKKWNRRVQTKTFPAVSPRIFAQTSRRRFSMIPVSAPEKVSDEDGDPALRPGGSQSAWGQGRHSAFWDRLTTPATDSPPRRTEPKFFLRATGGRPISISSGGQKGRSAQATTRRSIPGNGQA